MLEKIDLSQRLKKSEYKEIISDLEVKLAALQREAIELKVPIVIVFEGWKAAGKGTLINKLISTLDPRHFTVYSIRPPTEEEFYRPFLWRFWIKTPARGRMAIFDRSWYSRVLRDRVDKTIDETVWRRAYHEINSFERHLTNDRSVIIKFFLHISKKKQRNRFRKLEKNDSTAWRVTEEDWDHHNKYDAYFAAVEDMLAKTETGYAPWTIIESHDRRLATAKIFQTAINTLAHAIDKVRAQSKKSRGTSRHSVVRISDVTTSVLDGVNLSKSISREKYDDDLKKYQARIRDLEHEVYVKRMPVIIVYEGWDAAGKGGNIKRLTREMDPRGYDVIPIAAPNDIERRHHYLWRFWTAMPKAGHIGIFDRSWYGRVMVERVERLCTEEEWRRAYQEINEMEEQLTSFGAVLVKFWLHIDRDEQLRRFKERQKAPHKRWKITDEDWRNRKKWGAYLEAVEEMLFRTSTAYAPWTIVESNSKHYARLKALKTVIKAIEAQL